MAVSGDSAAIKQMLNNMSSEELLKYYDGDSSISASLFNDHTFPFWAFLVLAAFILLFALLRLHAATLTFSILKPALMRFVRGNTHLHSRLRLPRDGCRTLDGISAWAESRQ